MIILPYGDSALLINFEQIVDEAVNQQVIALHNILKHWPEVKFTIPAYCSLTVGFEKALTSQTELKEKISATDLSPISTAEQQRTVHIPVCYEGDLAPDMRDVAEISGLSHEEIIVQHTAQPYRVFMLGFVAGFAYMGKLPEALQCPRRHTPRKEVPEGAVGLAGFQTGIYPTIAPGGWQLIGQTPVKTFDPVEQNPSLLQPGDLVQFRAISRTEFDTITDSVRIGGYKPEVSHG